MSDYYQKTDSYHNGMRLDKINKILNDPLKKEYDELKRSLN